MSSSKASSAFPLNISSDADPGSPSAAAAQKPTLRRSARQLAKHELSDSMDIDTPNIYSPAAQPNHEFDGLFTTAGAMAPARGVLTEAEEYAQYLRTLLPAVRIPAVTNASYELHNASLPSNIHFQARVRRSGGIRALYPNTAVDEVMRLYYPDYRSWENILNHGIIGRMRVPSVDDIVEITLVHKRRGWDEEDNQGEKLVIRPERGDWENVLTHLRERGIGANVGTGLRGSHTVKLLIKLAN